MQQAESQPSIEEASGGRLAEPIKYSKEIKPREEAPPHLDQAPDPTHSRGRPPELTDLHASDNSSTRRAVAFPTDEAIGIQNTTNMDQNAENDRSRLTGQEQLVTAKLNLAERPQVRKSYAAGAIAEVASDGWQSSMEDPHPLPAQPFKANQKASSVSTEVAAQTRIEHTLPGRAYETHFHKVYM